MLAELTGKIEMANFAHGMVSALQSIACHRPWTARSRPMRGLGRAGSMIGAMATAMLMASSAMAAPAPAADRALRFDASHYIPLNVTIDGQPVAVRWYKEICYVAKPVAMAGTQTRMFGPPSPIANTQCGYQSMNIFVPESAVNNQKTAIYFAESNGGWLASYVKASVTDHASFDSATSNVGAALKAGYVYIDVATRGRGVVAADGSQAGKAPAVVVDAKAAIRYLRLNDRAMPGSAERIVVNGTSGGGGLGAILGASGNSADYLPYLAQIGAAGVAAGGKSTLRDDVFAVNIYCPITDLGNADMAYEWLYSTLNTRKLTNSDPDPKGSAEIASAYPASLHLKDSAGQPLLAESMLAEIRHQVTRSAEAAMAAGVQIPALGQDMAYTSGGFGPVPLQTGHYVNDWIDADNATGKVRSINIERYLVFVATQAHLKDTPAFDARGLANVKGGMSESTLFGTGAQVYANFTPYAWNHNDTAKDGNGLDDTGLNWQAFGKTAPGAQILRQVDLINPMHYIGSGAVVAPYWYIRHGTRDRDTAFTVSINLDRALAAERQVKDLNYRLAWDRPHSGNYDVPEAMAWIAKVLDAAGAPSVR